MILDITDATFEADVLQRSMTTPVVVDLWAPWCGPCKTLTPILEKVVGEAGGKVVLAKINVDENPAVSQAFRVQSIPAVFAFDQGQVVANFMGAQPEAQVRSFVGDLLGDAIGGEVAALIAQGDEDSLRKAIELDGSSAPARMLLARVLVDSDRVAEAVEVLAAAPEPDPQIDEMLEVVRSMALPTTEQTRIETRLAELLAQVKGDDEARTEFIGLLDELATGDPEAAAGWRRKLSTQLF
jgi:putative thioredoxin